MIELKETFTKRDKTFTQLFKNDCLVIYKVTYPKADNKGEGHYFEVFKYKTHQPDRFHTDWYEQYPNDEAFGAWAFTALTDADIQRIISKHFQECPDLPW